jgi:hypothetical protein
MRSLAETIFSESSFDVECELPRAGSALENPYVYDAAAKDLKALAERGLIQVVSEQSRLVANESLIARFSFVRMR